MEESGASQDSLQSVKMELQLCQKRLNKLTHVVEALLKMQAESHYSAGEKYTSLWEGISEVWSTSSIQTNRTDEFGLPMDA